MDSTTTTTTTVTTTKLSFNSIPIHNLSSLRISEISEIHHIADKEVSPEIEIIDDDLSATLCSAQQPPLLPGLIRNCAVPPPIPMQWQLTVPSESELEDYNVSSVGNLNGMDTLSPDDNDIFSNYNNSESSSSAFPFLPDIHGLHNSSSTHSNHSHSSMSSSASMTSLHSLSHISSIPSSSCSSNNINHHNSEWMSNEYDNITSPLSIDNALNNLNINKFIPSIPLKNENIIPVGNHIDDSNKFETNRDMIYGTLCQFEDGSCSKDVDDEDDRIQSDKFQSKHHEDTISISTKYETKHNLLMNGFIRDLQKEINQIIPKDINKICSEFYYEKEQKYIHLTYTIHNHHQQTIQKKDNNLNMNNQCEKAKDEFHDRPWRQNTFSGKELMEMMDNIDFNDNDTHFGSITMEEICDHLIEYGLIECVSYKTHFSALFTSNSNSISSSLLNWDKNQFKPSHDYLYNFTQNALSAIKQFNKNKKHRDQIVDN